MVRQGKPFFRLPKALQARKFPLIKFNDNSLAFSQASTLLCVPVRLASHIHPFILHFASRRRMKEEQAQEEAATTKAHNIKNSKLELSNDEKDDDDKQRKAKENQKLSIFGKQLKASEAEIKAARKL